MISERNWVKIYYELSFFYFFLSRILDKDELDKSFDQLDFISIMPDADGWGEEMFRR
jgi:hypothetical protein